MHSRQRDDPAAGQGNEWRLVWYGLGRWRRRRKAQLRDEPLCAFCLKQGKAVPAQIADHIEPHNGDWNRFMLGPLQSLCKPCHDGTKQSLESRGRIGERLGFDPFKVDRDGWPSDPAHPANKPRGGSRPAYGPAPAEDPRQPSWSASASHPNWLKPSTIPLTIVCGPPAAGKSTYVEATAGPTDLVIDLHEIGEEISGTFTREWSRNCLPQALQRRNDLLAELANPSASMWPAAWFIVSEPQAQWREWWARRLQAQAVIVVATPVLVCLKRIRREPGRVAAGHIEIATRWWRTYTRRAADIVMIGM